MPAKQLRQMTVSGVGKAIQSAHTRINGKCTVELMTGDGMQVTVELLAVVENDGGGLTFQANAPHLIVKRNDKV